IAGTTGIYDIEKILKKNFRAAKKMGHFHEFKGAKEAYIEKEISYVKLNELKPLKLVVDTGNGMAGILIRELFGKTPLQITYLFEKLDGNFPNHEANPIKDENIKDLIKEVKKQKADVGIALDGDADRIGLVDENGERVSSDIMGAAILPEIFKKHKKGLVFANVTCSQVVKEEARRLGGKFKECAVGHSLIKAQMRKEKAVYAMEYSGHFFMKDNYYLETPFAVALMILHRMSKENKSLSELVKPLRKYFATGEINFEVHDKEGVMKKIEKAFKSKAKKVSKLDGIKMEFADFWFNVRASNTEPLLRLNLEAKTPKRRDEMKKKIVAMIKNG
ncbi:MAG: phosphomannomutase/phosphoglucomutase, partial [Nanoarchaeota archaeon]